MAAAPTVVVAAPPTQLSTFQMDLIRNMVEESLEKFRASIHGDVVNVHVELIRQFQIQQNMMTELFEQYSVNKALVDEIEQLKRKVQDLQEKY